MGSVALLATAPPSLMESEVIGPCYAMSALDATHILKIDDPAERARCATDAISDLMAQVHQLSDVRRNAVAELRRTHTQREVAAILAISQARVNQLDH